MQISRPRLNYLIILGAFLFYFTMILFAIPTRNKDVFLGLVQAIPYTMALGFSLCYGTIIMKMFRVYYIVNNPLPNKVHNNVLRLCMMLYNHIYIQCLYQNIKDGVLALGILVFVIIDIVLLILSTALTEIVGQSMVILVPNRDNPRTVTGVSPFPKMHKLLAKSVVDYAPVNNTPHYPISVLYWGIDQ